MALSEEDAAVRGVSAGGGLGQGLPYVPRGIVPKFPVECPPYVYIAWERLFEVFIANQGLGHLMWLANQIRPDILNAVRAVARYSHAPKRLHWQASMHVLMYVRFTSSFGITFQSTRTT